MGQNCGTGGTESGPQKQTLITSQHVKISYLTTDERGRREGGGSGSRRSVWC